MLDLRLYRLTLLPFALGLIVVAFSLHPRPAALSSPLPVGTFDATQAAATMAALAGADPTADRSPGSAADDALARTIASAPPPRGLAEASFQIRIVRSSVSTILGPRTIESVIATRAGKGPGIALIADRGSARHPLASAFSPTATLLELAALYRDLATTHPLTLVSTAGGASGVGAIAHELPGGLEAAIVIGDVAGTPALGPALVPWSGAGAMAPIELRLTAEAALSSALGTTAADVGLADQFARLALPLTTGAQGPLGASGVPAVLIGSGEREPPGGRAATSTARLAAFGQAILGTLGALDGGPALPLAPTRDLAIGTQVLDGWGVRVLGGLLALSLLGCTLDVLARALRRKRAVACWIGWVLSFAIPFAAAALFAVFLGAGGLLPATPSAPVSAQALPIGSAGFAALVSVGLLFALTWVLRAAARARGPRRGAPEPVGAAAALLVTGSVLAVLLWLANPYTALLLILPLHVWLVALTREPPLSRTLGAVALVLSLAPLGATLALLCSGLGVGPLGLLWMVLVLFGGGGVSLGGLLSGGVAAGCFVAAAVLLLRRPALAPDPELEITVRGPLSYAGPGSLGGTQSALRH